MLLIGLLGAGCPLAGAVWSPVAPLPHGIAGFAAGVVDNQLIVAGGTTWSHGHKSVLASVLVFNPVTNRWRELRAWARPFAFGPFGVWRNTLVAFGGYDGVLTLRDRADLSTTTMQMPEPVAYAGSTLLGDNLYVLGGTPDIHEISRASSSFLTINLSTGTANVLADYPGGARLHVALTALDGQLWAFGGGVWDRARGRLMDAADAWSYDPLQNKWRPISPLPYAARGTAIAALDDRHILLAGGHRGSAGLTDACLIYDIKTDAYRTAAKLPLPVMLAGLVRIGGGVYLFGGEDAPKHRNAAVYHTAVDALMTQAAESR